MKVDKIKTERQRQIGNVQKQLLNNYFLQKYTNIMSKITNKPEVTKTIISKESKPHHNKKNFKNVLLQKKNQTQNSPFQKLTFNQSPKKQTIDQKLIQWSKKSNQKKLESNLDEKTIEYLESSIVDDLYKQSPTQLERGSYKILEVQRNLPNIWMPQQSITQSNINEVINVTYDSSIVEQNHQEEDKQDKKYEQTIRQEIKRQFSNRKSRKSSPKKSLEKNKQSQVKSSKISVQIHIQSPRGITNHNKLQTQFSKQRQKYQHNQQQLFDTIKQNKPKQQSQFKGPQVHFTREIVQPLKLHQSQSLQPENSNSHIQEQEIQFVAPSSNYYRSQNPNFVEDTFRFQEKSNSQKDNLSEKQMPQIQNQNMVNNLLHKDRSKKSLRSGSKEHNQGKESSQIQMSFISRLSLISSQEGFNIRTSIQKQLYENELGPYQSGLYNLLDLMQKYPRSGPVYAVAQRTLDDRKRVQERKAQQANTIQDLRKKIQQLKKKSEVSNYRSHQQSVIKKNKLQILRLIRKISSQL